MKRWVGFALAVVAACAAHTELKLGPPQKDPVPVYVGDHQCMVRDFENATDLPDGSKNLGWVVVPIMGGDDDEATYIEMRKRICAMGGNALSQPAWVKDVDDDAPKLKANAWALP